MCSKSISILFLCFLVLVIKDSIVIAACTSDEFQCNSGECIPLSSICDGEADCPDGEDERFCSTQTVNPVTLGACSPGDFECDDGQCINGDERCDGVADCPGGEDEFNCY